MPDIAMCLNSECPLKEKCYRFTATPDKYWQAYSDFEPYTLPNKKQVTCDAFIPNTTRETKVNPLNEWIKYFNIIANQKVTSTL